MMQQQTVDLLKPDDLKLQPGVSLVELPVFEEHVSNKLWLGPQSIKGKTTDRQ